MLLLCFVFLYLTAVIRGSPIVYRGDTEHMKVTARLPHSYVAPRGSNTDINKIMHKVYSRSVAYEKPRPSPVYRRPSTETLADSNISSPSTLSPPSTDKISSHKPTTYAKNTRSSAPTTKVPSPTPAYTKATTTDDPTTYFPSNSTSPTTPSVEVTEPAVHYNETTITVSSKATSPTTPSAEVTKPTVPYKETTTTDSSKATGPTTSSEEVTKPTVPYKETTTTDSSKATGPTTSSGEVTKPTVPYEEKSTTISAKTANPTYSSTVVPSSTTSSSKPSTNRYMENMSPTTSLTRSSDNSFSSTKKVNQPVSTDNPDVHPKKASDETAPTAEELKDKTLAQLTSEAGKPSPSKKQAYTVPSTIALKYLAHASVIHKNL